MVSLALADGGFMSLLEQEIRESNVFAPVREADLVRD